LNPPTPAEWLSLLVEQVPALRKSGVRKLTIGEMQLEIDPPEPVIEVVPPKHEKPDSIWDEPELYGHDDMNQVPGFTQRGGDSDPMT